MAKTTMAVETAPLLSILQVHPLSRPTVRAFLPRSGISDANPPQDAHVVEITSGLARLAAEGTTLCDMGALVRALGSFVSSNFSIVASIVVDTFCSMPTLTGPTSSRHSTGLIDMESIRPC